MQPAPTSKNSAAATPQLQSPHPAPAADSWSLASQPPAADMVDGELQSPPLSDAVELDSLGHRRVRFSDSIGLSLSRAVLFRREDAPLAINPFRDHLPPLVTDALVSPKMAIAEGYKQPASAPDFAERVRSNPILLENTLTRRANLYATVIVHNLAYDKSVTARYSTDGWKTFKEEEGAYANSTPLYGMMCDRFVLVLRLPETLPLRSHCEFAIRYRAGGQEYWDSNEGQNYHIDWIVVHFPNDATVPVVVDLSQAEVSKAPVDIHNMAPVKPKSPIRSAMRGSRAALLGLAPTSASSPSSSTPSSTTNTPNSSSAEATSTEPSTISESLGSPEVQITPEPLPPRRSLSFSGDNTISTLTSFPANFVVSTAKGLSYVPEPGQQQLVPEPLQFSFAASPQPHTELFDTPSRQFDPVGGVVRRIANFATGEPAGLLSSNNPGSLQSGSAVFASAPVPNTVQTQEEVLHSNTYLNSFTSATPVPVSLDAATTALPPVSGPVIVPAAASAHLESIPTSGLEAYY
ncbi:hypothetical protein CAOG_01001 [Capsaspora owczarzaki ATCC 30864]|uniref:hypothetical protein n=1 Tax=Capsaspora owczarzaki (strain ATCC 30864) TaxID=595528 RepID=UPI0001FE3AF1|nr:hypothetical protein CAOG_01001 [Capsaspora owczarzaki ATCC 30864]|eukprot:XP_004365872.1 hypothetical protein CAOG_01001 [Capsaspora owczarzaki ATCC 30864]